MPVEMFRFRIAKYNVQLGGGALTVGGSEYECPAVIRLLGEAPCPADLVTMSFLADADGLPPHTTTGAHERYVVNMYFPISLYAPMIDLLRNESPIYCRFTTGMGKSYAIETGGESPGEGE